LREGSVRGIEKAQVIMITPKFKYAFPLDDEIREKLEALRQPYPKEITSAESSDQRNT
jgi:hypothetical protein